MNNNKLVLVFLFCVLIFINSCGESLSKNSFKHSQTTDILDKCKCKQYCLGEVYDLGCLFREAVHPQNCVDFEGILIAHKNSYRGQDDYFTASNKEECFKILISKQNNIELCKYFPQEFNYLCFATVGKKNLEEKYCKEISYNYKAECYLFISKNKKEFSLNLCDELNQKDRITCYSNRATIDKDSAICLNLENNKDKNNCYSQIYKKFDPDFGNTHYVPIYYDWFMKEKFDSNTIDESYCIFESASGDDNGIRRNDSCYISLAMYHKNLNECYKLPRDQLGANLIGKCLFYTALWNNFELKDCDKLGVDFKGCRNGVALSKRDVNFCKEVYITEIDKSDCIYKIATDYFGSLGKKNILLCKDAGNYKGDCITAIYKEEDEQFLKKEVCELLSDSNQFLTFGAKCYYKFALKNLDLDSCNQIDDLHSAMRSDCKERVQNAIKNS